MILQIGKKYDLDELDDIFNFNYKKPSGIKESRLGLIVLFSNETTSNPYEDKHFKDVVLYEGQNTGPGVQELKFGNQALYDAG